MVKAQEVANTLLVLNDSDQGDELTNLKLQKLLYYCQGFNLAINNSPLFGERIIHWEHGPVVIEVYKKYQGTRTGIPAPKDYSPEGLSGKEFDIISEVNRVYGQFSAWKLRDMTHKESPWIDTDTNEEITQESLKSFFSTLVTS